jgi:hypothetical protein
MGNKSISLENRIRFILSNYDENFYKCDCGKTFTFNKYCRFCPVDRSNMKHRKHSLEVRRKMRLSAIKNLNNQSYRFRYKKFAPAYNPRACQLFRKLNKEND